MNPDLAQPTTTPLGEIISPCHISDSPPPRIRFYINSEPGGEQLPFLCALSIALFVNPNVTSLYRLYRDRLSKAFLFNPSTEVQRDRSHDLPAYLPKLHELKTLFCPYPIINAAFTHRIAGASHVGSPSLRPFRRSPALRREGQATAMVAGPSRSVALILSPPAAEPHL